MVPKFHTMYPLLSENEVLIWRSLSCKTHKNRENGGVPYFDRNATKVAPIWLILIPFESPSFALSNDVEHVLLNYDETMTNIFKTSDHSNLHLRSNALYVLVRAFPSHQNLSLFSLGHSCIMQFSTGYSPVVFMLA